MSNKVLCSIRDAIEWARRESECERMIAQHYDKDGFPSAAIPHDAASAALERLARHLEIMVE